MYGGKVKRLDVKMIKDGFSVFLKKSEIFRNGYLKNLKYPDEISHKELFYSNEIKNEIAKITEYLSHKLKGPIE